MFGIVTLSYFLIDIRIRYYSELCLLCLLIADLLKLGLQRLQLHKNAKVALRFDLALHKSLHGIQLPAANKESM